MWALVENNLVTQVYTRPKDLEIESGNYSRSIFTTYTIEGLQAIGIYEVVLDNSNFKNKEYYINTNQTFEFADGVVTASFGTATAKAIADTLYTAQDETDGFGTEGEVASRGLKYNHKETINQQAGGLLQKTDWMVIRAAEGGTAVPSDITTWRAAVRTKANAMQVQIDGAADVDALAALYAYTYADPDDLTSAYTRPLGDFPVLVG
jgi:hypothetical protein